MVEDKLIKIDEFIPHVLKNPSYYSIRILPPSLKQRIRNLITDHIHWVVEYAKVNPPDTPKLEHVVKWGGKFELMGIPKVTGHGKLDIQINELNQCLVFMESADESHLIPEFIRVTEELDLLRNESTKKVIPELASLWSLD